jgi:tryptophanyl-tRNA synthetase
MSIETDDTPLENPKDPDNCNVFNLIEFFADNKKTEDIRKKYLA